jgi:hypothetical protein
MTFCGEAKGQTASEQPRPKPLEKIKKSEPGNSDVV